MVSSSVSISFLPSPEIFSEESSCLKTFRVGFLDSALPTSSPFSRTIFPSSSSDKEDFADTKFLRDGGGGGGGSRVLVAPFGASMVTSCCLASDMVSDEGPWEDPDFEAGLLVSGGDGMVVIEETAAGVTVVSISLSLPVSLTRCRSSSSNEDGGGFGLLLSVAAVAAISFRVTADGKGGGGGGICLVLDEAIVLALDAAVVLERVLDVLGRGGGGGGGRTLLMEDDDADVEEEASTTTLAIAVTSNIDAKV